MARGGDEDFDVMFHRTLARAIAVARRMVGDPSLAEDLAAEAFTRAYARWPRLRSSGYVEGWVLRVVTNLAIDHLRRQPPNVPASHPIDGIEAATLRLALADAMARLPRRQREVVALRYFSDLSEADVAGTLGVSIGAVKSHHRRALDSLQLRFRDLPREDLFVAPC
jgi:RNA polymerase sigma-70 factor (sigma-E family)